MPWNVSTATLQQVARQVFMPLNLLVNYTLFQYIVVFYWARRGEWRVRFLYGVAALSALALIPFANSDGELVERLNSVSEFSCAVTFLLQITIIGYDLNKKMRFRTVRVLTRVSQLLTIIDLIEIVRALLSIFFPSLIHEEIAELFPTVCENLTLGAIFVFRLYYVVISRGWADVWRNRKLEVAAYLLFALHEIPFLILEYVSGLSWEYAQALWERVTLAGCLYITATNKLRGPGSSRSSERYKSQEFRRASVQRPSILAVKTASVQRMSASQIVVPAISDRTASCDSIKPSSALAAQVYSKSAGLNSQILE